MAQHVRSQHQSAEELASTSVFTDQICAIMQSHFNRTDRSHCKLPKEKSLLYTSAKRNITISGAVYPHAKIHPAQTHKYTV